MHAVRSWQGRRPGRLMLAALAAGACVAAVTPSLTTAQDRAGSPADEGYAIGYDLGRDIAAQLLADGVTADRAAVVKGFTDAIEGRACSLGDDRMEQTLTGLHRRIAEGTARERYARDPVFRATADRNKAAGDAFRETFARREGAKTLSGGVICSVVRAGTGDVVGDAATVVANYVAMLPDGSEYARGRGAEFKVATLLPGVQEFVRAMRVGERAYVAIPPERAHGLAGKDGEIGPNETVVLDVEIVDVKR